MSWFAHAVASVAGRVVGTAAAYGLKAVLPCGLPSWDELFNEPADRLWSEKTTPKKPRPDRELLPYLDIGLAFGAGDFGKAVAILKDVEPVVYGQLMQFGYDLETLFGVSLMQFLKSSSTDGVSGDNVDDRGPSTEEIPVSAVHPSADTGQPAFTQHQFDCAARALHVYPDYCQQRGMPVNGAYWRAQADEFKAAADAMK